VYYCLSKHNAFFDIMLTNILHIFSETPADPAHFGLLKFIYTDEADKKIKNDDKNNRLSSVSHSDLCTAFGKSKIHAIFSNPSRRVLVLTGLLIFNLLSLHINFS
jgi:hypothetical protein